MTTALTLYGYDQATTTLATAAALTTVAASGTTSPVATALGTAQNWGEVAALGTTAAWPDLLGQPDPSGRGFLYDTSILYDTTIAGGAWTVSLGLQLSAAGTVTADVYVRVGVFNGVLGSITPYGTLVLAGQSLTNSPGTYTLTGTLPPVPIAGGDKLYLDVWLNVTFNPVGNTGLTVQLLLPPDAAHGGNTAEWVTPGWTFNSAAVGLQSYAYGAFNLNDGVAFLCQEKDLDFLPIQQSLYAIARLEGMKKTAERVNERKIAVRVRVIGTSRPDLESKIDALFQALQARQQRLNLHMLDTRYWVADATAAPWRPVPGKIAQADVTITFVAQEPYGRSVAASSAQLGPAAFPLLSGTTWQSSAVFSGGGSIYAWPTITLTNNTPQNALTLNTALVSGTPTTTLSVTSVTNAIVVGDSFTLSNTGHTQVVVASAAVAASGGVTSIPVTSFTPNFSYPASTTTVTKDATITSVTVSQTPDDQTMTVTQTLAGAAASGGSGDALLITCDPTAANGYTVLLNGAGSPLAFTGLFPSIEPGPTTYTVAVVANSPPTVTVAWSWAARWLN